MTPSMPVLQTIAFLSILLSLLSAAWMGRDLLHRPQPMRIMNGVWLLTALWAGVAGLIAYFVLGRAPRSWRMRGMRTPAAVWTGHRRLHSVPGTPPRWKSLLLATLPVGAACTLADVAGEWVASLAALRVAGSALLGVWLLDYVLALVVGGCFRYAAIRDKARGPRCKVAPRAFVADFGSLTVWQAGVFGWMALVRFGLCPAAVSTPRSWSFWLMMQLGMGVGLLCASALHALLVRCGIRSAV